MRFKVEDKSMEPTLHSGDYVIAVKYIIRKPKEEDVVVLKHPKKEMKLIKRIRKIDNDKYFVEGNNRSYSSDSRDFGPIEKESIIGKVMFLKSKNE